MPQSFTRILLHTVFSTKYRRPTIRPEIETALHQYLIHRLHKQGSSTKQIGGTLDHVHILHTLPRTKTLAKMIEDAKSFSSKWMAERGYVNFWWQDGYASFSVSAGDSEGVRRYIRNQKVHHYGNLGNYHTAARLTYEDEVRSLLDRYAIPYDPAYLFPRAPSAR